MTTIPAATVTRINSALPFWLSLALVPVVIVSALYGGWTVALMPIASWGMFSLLDAIVGKNPDKINFVGYSGDNSVNLLDFDVTRRTWYEDKT